MEVLCSVIMQKKTASCKEEAMAQLKEETILRARNFKLKGSVGIDEEWEMLSPILDTEAASNLFKENCLP